MVLPPRAYVFLSLNAVRILSILALLLVFSSNILIMVEDIKAVRKGSSSLTLTDASGQTDTYECDYFDNSTVPNQPAGAFWAVVNRLFIIATTVLLILSEVGWPEQFFILYLPVLGHDFGVGILGGIQWIIAASILSHHVDDFPLVAGFFLFVVGCFNILLGLIFRASVKDKRSITTFRQAKASELLPGPIQARGKEIRVLQTSVSSIFTDKPTGVMRQDTGYSAHTAHTEGSKVRFGPGYGPGYGFARQGEKKAAHDGFLVSRPMESLPRYHTAVRPQSTSDSDSDHDEETTAVSGYQQNKL